MPALIAGIHRPAHGVGVHQAIVVGHHDAVDPAQRGRPEQALLHVAVGAEPEEADLALGLGLFPHVRMSLSMVEMLRMAWTKNRSMTVGAHALQRQIEVLGHALERPGRRFGHEENMLAILRVLREILADAELAVAALVGIGRVPVGDAPLHRLPQHELVVGDVEHPAHGQDGDICPGLPERPGRHHGRLLGRQEIGGSRRGQQTETGCPGGFQKLPA